MRGALTLALFLVGSFAAAAFGALFPPSQWYETLVKPSWNPPAWVFGPVWTVLYASIGVSGWLAWRARHRPEAFAAFAVQLALNAAWPWLFFGLHRPGLAFAEIVLLWLSILMTVVLFWRIRPLAGVLLLPYLAWVGFAAGLNLALWRLNS